jgi:hypothetical protein
MDELFARNIWSSRSRPKIFIPLVCEGGWHVGNFHRHSNEFVSKHVVNRISGGNPSVSSFNILTGRVFYHCLSSDRHRLRMGSKPLLAGHVFFGTFMVVMAPSYYFCYRRREHKENVIEMMSKYMMCGKEHE